MWEIALRLNSLRNELAHSLQSQKRVAKTQAVIDVYFQEAADMPHLRNLRATLNQYSWLTRLHFFLVSFRPFWMR